MAIPNLQMLYQVMASRGITIPNNINNPTDIIDRIMTNSLNFDILFSSSKLCNFPSLE